MAHRTDPLNSAVGARPSNPRAATRRRGYPKWVVWLGFAAFEWCWLAWFLVEPLPNAGNAGGAVRRWILLASAFPNVIPGLTFRRSLLGLTLSHLSGFENLPQRVPIVAAGVLIIAAAYGLGRRALELSRVENELAPVERIPLACLVGVVLLGLITLVTGRLGLLSPWPTRALLMLCALDGLRGTVRSFRSLGSLPKPSPAALGSIFACAPFVILASLAAMLPSTDFDAIEYHLEGPKEYFLAGKIELLPHNVYTSMPFGIEMMHLLGMESMNDWWRGALAGQFVVMTFAIWAGWMIWLTARRWGSSIAAWCALLVYLTTPWVYRLASISYVEGPMCAFHAALVWAAGRAWESEGTSRNRFWGLAGLLAGGAFVCKYPGLVSAVVPFGLLSIAASRRARTLAPSFAFAAGCALATSPWLIKNLIDTGNPVYPLAYRLFGGVPWDAALDAKWSGVHGPRAFTLQSLVNGLLDVAGRSDWHSPLYTALAPLALWRRGSSRIAIALWVYVVYLFSTWLLLTHQVDRFWLPLLPAFAVLAGLGADRLRTQGMSTLLALVLIVGYASNLAYVTTPLAGDNEWTGDLGALRKSLPKMLDTPLALLDETLPASDRPLLVGQAAVFHMEHRPIYNTVFNHELIETLTRGRSPTQVREALLSLGATHVYVDWHQIERYRSPGNYGFTNYVTPELFAKLVSDGVLEIPAAVGPRQELYALKSGSADRSK